ncbi:MAG: peptidoglycan DD-metalloendopeptidase family protein [Ruminiclostridium sp.]|nr:peptidoglycan DD-metalloendopeptidase family protein [Ruminiclostridium sp.]
MHHPNRPYPMEDLTGPEEFFCQLADLEEEYQRPPHRRALRKKPLLAAALAGLTGLSLLGAVAASTCTLCYAVSSQGDPPLAYVQGELAYTQAVDRVEEQVSQILHTQYEYPQEAQMELAIAPRGSVQTPEELSASLMETVDQVREVWVLTVDGVAAGACATKEEVETALDLVKEGYSNQNTTSVTLCGEIGINLDYLPAEADLYDAETLAGALMLPTEEEEVPLLTVETVEEVTYTQAIPAPTREQADPALLLNERKTVREGTEGREERTDRVTRRCGVETGRENLAGEVLTEPVPQVVAVGTAQGVEAARGRFLWPTTGQITSPFGYRTIFGSTSFHRGLDIANTTGTEILASAGGTVTWAGAKGTYGNLLILDHGNGFTTYYAHCSQILAEEGDTVKQGEKIALMGSTGRSTGPHLHFEVRWQNEPLDPEKCLP